MQIHINLLTIMSQLLKSIQANDTEQKLRQYQVVRQVISEEVILFWESREQFLEDIKKNISKRKKKTSTTKDLHSSKLGILRDQQSDRYLWYRLNKGEGRMGQIQMWGQRPNYERNNHVR